MNKYYIEFKTWREGNVTMPGIYKILGETNEYRKRSNLNIQISDRVIQSVFLSFNDERVQKFLDENVSAYVIAIISETDSQNTAIQLLEEHLGPIEIIGVVEINSTNYTEIQKVMGDALNEHPL